jgi:hypothetical protein
MTRISSSTARRPWKGSASLKKKKIVNLVEMRRLAIGLIAIEVTIKERIGGEI